jgi:hypothetical protein
MYPVRSGFEVPGITRKLILKHVTKGMNVRPVVVGKVEGSKGFSISVRSDALVLSTREPLL